MHRTMKVSSSGSIFLTLFSLPFMGIGIGMLVALLLGFMAQAKMATWDEVPATLLDVHLHVSRGDDSTSYRATAQYSYEVDGASYRGERVSIHKGNDNLGKYHQRMVQRLEKAMAAGQTIPVFVNPDDPSEAIIDRRLRIEKVGFMSLFALVFGGVGLGLFIAGLKGGTRAKARSSLEQANPEKPWKWKPEWQTRDIQSETQAGMWFAVIFAVFWNLVSLPVLIFVPEELRGGNHLALIGLLFPLIGLGLMVWAVKSTIRHKMFGGTVFKMSADTGIIGGPLGGIIRLPKHLEPEDGFLVSLSCINKVVSGSGKSRSTQERVLWQEEKRMGRELMQNDLTQSAVPLLFGIPFDARPCNDENSNNEIFWRLEIKAKVAGPDLYASFRVPVFRTPQSAEDFRVDDSKLAAYEIKRDAADLLRGEKIYQTPLAGTGQRFHLPMFRHPGTAVMLLVFTLVWAGICVGLWRSDAPRLFPIIFSFFGVLIFLGCMESFFASQTLEVRHGELSVRSGWFNAGRVKRYTVAEVGAIRVARGTQSGNKLYHNLKLEVHGGKDVTVVKAIGSRHAAEALVETLMGELNNPRG